MEANNMAAMREALVAILDEKCKQCYINDQICTQGLECHWNGKRGEICQDKAMDKAIAALAAPPRNCDRFATVKDAAIAFARERQDAPHPCPDFTFSTWLFATAVEQKGETNDEDL